jgi:hypothetical protein
MAVFEKRDVPQWIAATYHALPNCDLLTETCLGVLVSLNYNRGVGGYNLSGDRYTEMRQIKEAMATRRFVDIPDLLDKMARLWPNNGVGTRRHKEAALFREGLKEELDPTPAPAPLPPDPQVIASNREEQPARTPQPTTTPAQHTTTGAIVLGGVAAGQKAAEHGFSPAAIAAIVGASVVVAGVVWLIWYRDRNPTPAPASS